MYHNRPFTKLILILAAASLLCANSNTEKLARKVERDNKQVVKWNDKAQKDGQVLDAACQEIGKRAGQLAPGVLGCVVWEGRPLPPPTTTKP